MIFIESIDYTKIDRQCCNFFKKKQHEFFFDQKHLDILFKTSKLHVYIDKDL